MDNFIHHQTSIISHKHKRIDSNKIQRKAFDVIVLYIKD